MMPLVSLLVIVIITVHAFARGFSCSHPIRTSNGPVVGHSALYNPYVCEYLGIPYALAPLGRLRFAPPQRFYANKTYNATRFPPDCPQPSPRQVIYPNATPQELRIIANFANQVNNHTQSEDCLSLNIWSKASSETNKPTLVFFHGGRWTGGTSNTPFYNGEYLSSTEDVIVVTLNFRLNIFGFPGAPGHTGNLGLLDQRRAIEWIRDNIAAFGGTSSKITIVGQSSGGVAADMWAYAYRSDPIISGLISHSGNAISFPVHTPTTAAMNWYNVSAQVGCGVSGDVMDCMRSLPFEQIRAAAALVRPPPADSITRSIPVFQPVIDNATVFNNYTVLSEAGLFAQLPYFQGYNDNESGYYKITTYGSTNTTAPDSVWDAFELESFICPAAFQAKMRARRDIPTYLYRYFADWENLRLYPGSGAYHGSEMNMVIGNSEGVSGIPPSGEEQRISKVMMRAWAAFAENPERGLVDEMGWPRYKTNEQMLIRLGYDNSPVPDFITAREYDAACFPRD